VSIVLSCVHENLDDFVVSLVTTRSLTKKKILMENGNNLNHQPIEGV